MASVTRLALRCVFADDTVETITINNIDSTAGVNPDIKQLIRNFNAQGGGTLSTKMKSTNGANWIGIDKATITRTDRTYIF